MFESFHVSDFMNTDQSFSGVWFIDTPAQITAEWVPKIEKLYYGIKI
jgi:hypothetical protein